MVETRIRILNQELKSQYFLFTTEKPANFTHIPGQYTTLRQNESDTLRYFAIYSPPAQPTLTFLVKGAAHAHDFVESGELLIGQPMGSGFPAEHIHDRHIVIITHGSGYSAFHALLAELAQSNRHKSITFCYSAKDEENDMSDKPLLGSIKNLKSHILYTSTEKRIQFHLSKYLPEERPAVALLVGSKEFTESVKKILKENNFSENQILTNF